MLTLVYTRKMKRDVRRMQKRGKNMDKLAHVLKLLVAQQSLPAQFRDHQLTGSLKDFRECHIEPNWLLMYQISDGNLVLTASATGTHSDLFDE